MNEEIKKDIAQERDQVTEQAEEVMGKLCGFYHVSEQDYPAGVLIIKRALTEACEATRQKMIDDLCDGLHVGHSVDHSYQNVFFQIGSLQGKMYRFETVLRSSEEEALGIAVEEETLWAKEGHMEHGRVLPMQPLPTTRHFGLLLRGLRRRTGLEP